MSAEEAKEYGMIDDIIQRRIKSGGAPTAKEARGRPRARRLSRRHRRRRAAPAHA